MTHDDVITPLHQVPVTAVRVTWLDAAGTPDHPWAVTYHFTDPAVLNLARRRPAPSVISVHGGEYLAALTAPYDHPERMGVCYLAQSLRRASPGKSLEVWAEMEEGRWWYALLPWYLARPTADWPLEPERGQELHAAGVLRDVGAYTWPPLHPLREPSAVPPGTPILIADTNVPPPPHGFPDPARAQGRHARHPAPAA